jgi:transposase-like protein
MADGQISTRAARTTRAQRARVVEQYQQSGLTRVVFARRHGLAVWKLRRWLAEANAGSKLASSTMLFGELKLAPGALPEPAGWALEVVGANGVTIRLRQALTVRELSRLLRA